MERQILVVVKVSDKEHAKIIKEDINKVIKNRTSIYFIDEPRACIKTIEQLQTEACAF